MLKWLDLNPESLAPAHLTAIPDFLSICCQGWPVLQGLGHVLLLMQTQEPLSQGRRESSARRVRALDASQDN